MSDETTNPCAHKRTEVRYAMGTDTETCLDCGAWNVGSRANGWNLAAPSPSPRPEG